VAEQALIDALKDGRLKAAAIDVVEKEPYTKDGLYAKANLNNLIMSAHTAFYSEDGFIGCSLIYHLFSWCKLSFLYTTITVEMRTKAALEIKRGLNGKVRNCVNIKYLKPRKGR